MVIDDSLFNSASGHSKLRKRDRHLYLDELAEAVSNPDEIWLEYDPKRGQLVKKMLRFYRSKNEKVATMAVFEYAKDKTQGVSVYALDSQAQAVSRRKSKMIYQKESNK